MLVQISFRVPIVGHDGDHLQIAVRRLGRRRLLDKIGLDEGAFDGLLVKDPYSGTGNKNDSIQ